MEFEQFDRFDDIEVPEQWDEIVARSATAGGAAPRSGGRSGSARHLAWFAVAVVALVSGVIVIADRFDSTGSSDEIIRTASTGSDSDSGSGSGVTISDPSRPTTESTVPTGVEPIACATTDDLNGIAALLRTGQPTYDYQPARDLTELVGWADVVITGTVTSAQRTGVDFENAYTTLNVSDVEQLAGSGEVTRLSAMSLWAQGQGADPLADVTTFDGVHFVAFLNAFPAAPGGWAPRVEGLVFGCENGPAIEPLVELPPRTLGLSLDELAAAVRAIAAGDAASGELGIARPIFADAGCPALSATGSGPINGVTFFALLSNEPIPIQIIAEPGTTPADPYALVQRFAESGLSPRTDELADIGGYSVGIETFANGNGEAIWRLDDGTVGYLRSRGLNREDIVEIIESLVPEPPDAEFPGFRVDLGGGVARFQSLHEQLNTDVTGNSSRSECEVDDSGLGYEVNVVGGDPILLYGAVIDRPVPLEVGYREGSLLVISGPEDPSAPRVADVIDAEPDVWEELLRQPDPFERDGAQRTEPIGNGREVVLDAFDTVDRVSGSFRLRLVVEDGVSFLEVDTIDLVLQPGAEYQVLEIDGRLRARTTASVGPTLGQRIADDPLPGPFTVSITITDATDNVLQHTEAVRLVPETS